MNNDKMILYSLRRDTMNFPGSNNPFYLLHFAEPAEYGRELEGAALLAGLAAAEGGRGGEGAKQSAEQP